jgi:Tfp pilus assembly protein FimT
MRLKTYQNQANSSRRICPSLDRAGFSIVEVLGVVVIVAILSGFVLAPFSEYQGKMALADAVQEITGIHQQTRSAALRTGQLAELHLEASTGRFWIESQDFRSGVRDTIGSVRTVNSPVSVSTDATVLCFDTRGLPVTGTVDSGTTCEGPASTIVFTIGNVADTLQFTTLGRVSR